MFPTAQSSVHHMQSRILASANSHLKTAVCMVDEFLNLNKFLELQKTILTY